MGSLTGKNVHKQVGRFTKKLLGAVVDCIDNGEPPPAELRLAWDCKFWGTLPDTGAYYDQDYFLLSRMRALSNVYNAVSKLRNSKGTQIHSLTNNERMILKQLVDMGLLFNG
jgi:hypothetical protein